MKTKSTGAIPANATLALMWFAAAILINGCQSAPPVREHIARNHEPDRPSVLAYADYNSPTAGAPLYYDTTNLNWEEAPPYGQW